jgi:hypothetical protein
MDAPGPRGALEIGEYESVFKRRLPGELANAALEIPVALAADSGRITGDSDLDLAAAAFFRALAD